MQRSFIVETKKIVFGIFFLLLPCALLAQKSVVEGTIPAFPAFNATERLQGAPLAFIVFGDWGTGTKYQQQVAAGMADKYQKDGAVAVFTVGDNFYEKGVKDINDVLWKIRFEDMYPKDKLPVPFYATLGNHDYGYSPDAQVQYSGKRLSDGSTTRWRMPARYWSEVFDSKDGSFSVRVTGLDTQTLVDGKKESRTRQLEWLDSICKTNKAGWHIVIGHHPVYSNGMHGNTISMVLQAKPLFEKHHVDMYVSGHDHDLQVIKPAGGVQYVISGGGGASRDVRWAGNTEFAATNMGFVWLQANTSSLLLHVCDANGKTIYAKRIDK